MSRDRHTVWNLIDDIEFFDRDLVDFVEHVDARDIDPVALDDVNEVVLRGIVFEHDVGVVDFVLGQDGFHSFQVELRLRY